MLDFLLGAAFIVLPKHQLPILVAGAALKGIKHVTKRKQKHQPVAAAQPDEQPEAATTSTLLEWKHLSCTVTDKHGNTKTILSNLSGSAQPGRLLALMGPSGSGKTTLLNALAGQVPKAKGLRLRGKITVNSVPAAESKHRQGYVQQEDLFYSMLTVRETLMMQARLRKPDDPLEASEEYIGDLMKALGLSKSADTRVGDEKQRGLSGGEKKRLNIGCELIAAPKLLFADEPTTGLDSFQAEKVMQTLKGLAQEGNTVVCSIHQPRSSIFMMFDDLVLLSEGGVVYSGPAAESLDHFASLGHVCPEHYNPAEYLADLISIDHSSPEAEEESRARIASLVAAFRERQSKSAVGSPQKSLADSALVPAAEDDRPKIGWLKQFRMLIGRSWRQVTRDKATNVARAMSNISSAVVFGAIFWRMKLTQTSIQDRMGLMQVCAINTAMSSLIKTLQVFPTERTIVSRERAKRSYQVLPYLASKLTAELPIGALFPLLFGCIVYPTTGLNPKLSRFAKFLGILTLESFASSSLGLTVGAFAPSTEAAVAIGPAVMLVFIVFGGFYVNADNVPGLLKWIPRTSLIKQSFEALCINEFKGERFESEGREGDLTTGDQVLSRLSFANSSIPKALAGQARIMAFWYWASLCILRARKPVFQRLEGPQGGAEAAPGGEDAVGEEGKVTEEGALLV